MGGWDQMRSRLIGEGDDRPMLVCFSTCEQSIRTIPVLQHDKDKIEDLDTDGEDHAADGIESLGPPGFSHAIILSIQRIDQKH